MLIKNIGHLQVCRLGFSSLDTVSPLFRVRSRGEFIFCIFPVELGGFPPAGSEGHAYITPF
jgi:hypothetical protein